MLTVAIPKRNKLQNIIVLTPKDGAVVTVGNLRVELGDKKDMNGKIAELSDIIQEYSDLDGTLYLDTYDETNSNPMYRFQKNEP